MTSPTNRTDEVARQKVVDFVFRKFGHYCDGNHPKYDDCGTCECVEQVLEFTASAIKSAVEAERARCAKVVEGKRWTNNPDDYEARKEICIHNAVIDKVATAIRQIPTQDGV